MLDVLAAAGQVLIAGFPGKQPPPPLLSALKEGQLGGVILFARNLGTMNDVRELTSAFAAAAPGDTPPWICVDQEGGRVARLKAPVLTLPAMRQVGDLNDPAFTRRIARALGAQLLALGFNCDFAPVLDVDTNPKNPVIGDRSFSRDPKVVAVHGAAFAAGLADAGIIACGKHFPGHGDTDVDSHLALPTLRHSRDRLSRVEMVPFRETREMMPSIMTAHVVFEALDPLVPATLSPKMIQGLLREEVGYPGVIVSDDLEMKAVSERWPIPDAACLAIEAGCDAILICSDVDALFAARDALAKRAGKDAAFAARLREGAERGMALRRKHPPKAAPDAASLDRALTTGAALEVADELRSRLRA